MTLAERLHRADMDAAQDSRYDTNAKSVLSDYGDDTLDDLPSPSALLRETEPKPKHKDPSRKGNGKQVNKDKDLDELGFAIISPSPSTNPPTQRERVDSEHAVHHSIQPTPSGSRRQPDVFPISDSSCEVNADLGLVDSNDRRDSNRKKRQLSANDEPDGAKKRFKITSHEGQALSGLTESRQNSGCHQEDGQPSPAVQKGWEDIDPLLLDEFKDIVDFF